MADPTPAPKDWATDKMDPRRFDVAQIPMWGQLIPASLGAKPLDLLARQHEYTIGRHPLCDFIIPHPRISNRHCALSWDPARPAEVMIEDFSTNGKFINDAHVGKGERKLLSNGDELRLVSDGIFAEPSDDYHRYVYRHLGGPCGPSVFDEYTLLSAEIETHPRVLRWKAFRTRDRKACAAIVILPPKKARGYIPIMLAKATGLAGAPAHANVLAILAAFETPCSLQLITDPCMGETLPDVMLQHPDGMDEARAQALSRDICAGLEHLHVCGIHLPSLMPHSVFVAAGRATIDATRGSFPDYSPLVTIRPAFRPHPLLAPEWPASHITSPANVWSAGILGAFLLTGCLKPEDTPADFDARRRQPAPIDWEAMGTKSDEAQDWIQSMLTNDPHQRISLRAALEHPWLRDDTISAHSR